MQAHERLNVWRKSHELSLAVWRALDGKKGRGHATIANHLRSATLAITLRIAHGASRSEMGDFVLHLERALRSAHECLYLIRLAAELEALTSTERATLEARTDQICRMIESLKRHMVKQHAKRAVRSAAPRHATRSTNGTTLQRPARRKVIREVLGG